MTDMVVFRGRGIGDLAGLIPFATNRPLTPNRPPCCHGIVIRLRHWPRRAMLLGGAVFHPDLIRHPDGCPALVLNADYTPLSYYPLSVWPWQTAVKAVFLDRVDIVAHYEREVRSSSRSMKLPSVIALKQFVRPSQFPAFTRFNLFLRDRFTCQYCGHPGDLTFDHVVPRAQGGRTTWENVVTACAPCNLKKGGRTPRQATMPLHLDPIRPTSWQLQEHGKRFPPHYLHGTWHDWLYWDVELEA